MGRRGLVETTLSTRKWLGLNKVHELEESCVKQSLL
jgi:hypothetical protein